MDPYVSSVPLKIDELLQLHALTRDVAKLCQKQLRTHLDTLAVLFRPRRTLGDAIEGSEREATGGNTERNLADLRQLYQSVALRPFDLRPELKVPIESISATPLQVNEWEYFYPVKTEEGWQNIKVTSPLTWVISYPSPYSLSILRQVLAGNEPRNPDSVRAYVLRACLMHLQFEKFPGLSELFNGLRFKVETRRSPELGGLPLITISAPFSTMRPSDELVTVAAGLAGGATFAEVLDLSTARTMQDPLREEISAILSKYGREI